MRRPIEPGVLPLFRLFIVLQILLLLLRMVLERVFRADFPLVGSPWFGLTLLGGLLGYLSWSRVERWLGGFYLPLGLIFSVTLTLVGSASGMTSRLATGIRAEELVRGSWVLIVVLLVPLILVAWQYGFRWVLWFCFLTAAADFMLTAPLATRSDLRPVTLIVIAFVRSLFFLPVGYAVTHLVQAERHQREALAEQRERNRLAHELHDTLAHGLSSIAVQLEAMNALWKAHPDKARAMLSEALATTRDALGEARRAIGALRASPLEDLGLARALRALAESTAARSGLELDLRVPPCLDALDTENEHAVYRIAAEALANVARHAEARCLMVRVEESNSAVCLVVADDGRGFDTSAASDAGCFGLYGMRERARMMGAELGVESVAGAGTTVRLMLQRKA